MADQKAMKKRLKALMQRPENQVCSDCPEKRPTWASLIVPPPGAPPGTEKLGSFMCLECSGSHRRIGVHITFVRSVNLDAWKEWEVRAMENGGNAKINAIFEAKLAQSGRTKPTNLADGPTRERYIRDKYERRKFYDPAGFSMQSNAAVAPVSQNASGGGDFSSQSRPGAPSDVARRRVASRQARMKPPKSNPPVAKAPAVKVAQAPVSAPVEFDLLDFGSETTTTAGQTSSTENSGDVFSPRPVVSTASGMQKSSIPPPPKTAPPAPMPSTFAQELLNPATATKQTTSNDDIMALFVPSKQQQNQQPFGFGMQAMNQVRPNGSVNTNSMMNATQQTNMMTFNNQQNVMSQQQRQQMMQNNTMMSNGNQMMPNQMMPNQMVQQQMQQQQMMMQKQMMMQQQQMASQFHPNSSGSTNNMGMYSSTNGTNNFYGGVSNSNNMDPTIQGMRNMNIGNGFTQQSSDDGGFGTPMGGNSQQQSMKSDAFSSLGGMNAFR
mmetsp:Transcript_430/g.898  ORF Transcript_430/g.898 Transcript_430/m.898 type:complete len:494 (-) Transcript_430:395-1876(-)